MEVSVGDQSQAVNVREEEAEVDLSTHTDICQHLRAMGRLYHFLGRHWVLDMATLCQTLHTVSGLHLLSTENHYGNIKSNKRELCDERVSGNGASLCVRGIVQWACGSVGRHLWPVGVCLDYTVSRMNE